MNRLWGCSSPVANTVNSLICAIDQLRDQLFWSAISLLRDIIFLPFPHNNAVALCLLDLVHPRPKPRNLL